MVLAAEPRCLTTGFEYGVAMTGGCAVEDGAIGPAAAGAVTSEATMPDDPSVLMKWLEQLSSCAKVLNQQNKTLVIPVLSNQRSPRAVKRLTELLAVLDT